jgi:hypothetical protein
MNGQRTSTKPVEELVIAIDPEEIAELTAAMKLDATITCVARSGNPEDTTESITPGLPAAPPPTTIEAVRGTKTETLYFPAEPSAKPQPRTLPRAPLRRTPILPSAPVPVAANRDRV